jgi:leucyl-tRNA synthetase
MELTNVWSDAVTAGKGLDRDDLAIVAQLLAPFAPYLAEELWTLVEKEGSVHLSTWPSYNSEYVVENTVEYAVQVNGKVKAKCSIARTHTKEEITELVLDTPEVRALKAEASIKNIIVVPNRLVNIVV